MSIARWSACAAVALALAGCSSVGKLNPDPPHGIDLSGNWILDRDASDDPQKVLYKLRPKPVDPRYPQDDLAALAADDAQNTNSNNPRRRNQQSATQAYYRNNDAYTRAPVRKMLTADVARSEQVTVRQTPSLFSLDYGVTVRTFTPGQISVVSAEWGVADQSSGWQGKEYVIETKPQTGVASTEKFAISPDGKHLTEQLHLGGSGGFPPADLKRVYDRSDKPLPRALPTSD
jgi:hypothetical protein